MSYYTQSELLEMGITRSCIKKYFPNPDSISRNPYNKSASIKKYLVERVNFFKTTDVFLELERTKQARLEKAKKTRITREQNLLLKVEKFHIHVPLVKDNLKLKEDAVFHRMYYHEKKFGIKHYRLDKYYFPTEEFANDCIIDYILFELSNYPDLLHKLKGKPGAEKAKEILRQKFYDKIIHTYSFFDELDKGTLPNSEFECLVKGKEK